jgi:hypothetical protein
MRSTSSARATAIALSSLVIVGCGGRGDVSGTVSYNGRPLVCGTVQFEGSDGILRQGNIETDGRYTVRDVATGEAKAAVSSINPRSSDFIPIEKEGGVKMPRRPDVPGWFPIPPKYDAPHTSELTYTIQRGENKIDIELK